jgi:hypothetical protein
MKKGASFFGFGFVCLTLLKLIMDGKENWSSFFVLFCSIGMKKHLIFVWLFSFLFCSCSIQRMVEESWIDE